MIPYQKGEYTFSIKLNTVVWVCLQFMHLLDLHLHVLPWYPTFHNLDE